MCFTCSSRSSTFLCHPSLAAIISSSFCWESWVSAACLSASYSSVNSSLNKRTSSLQNDVGEKTDILFTATSHLKPLYAFINCIIFSLHKVLSNNSCCNTCYVSNMDCEAVLRDARKTHQNSIHEINCLEKDQKYIFCTAEHPSTSGPNHLPSYPSFVFLLFWLTSLWLHAVVAGNRSPPLNAYNTHLMSTDCWQNNIITYYIILLNQQTVLHLLLF